MLGALLLRDAHLQQAPTIVAKDDDAGPRVRARVLLALRQHPTPRENRFGFAQIGVERQRRQRKNLCTALFVFTHGFDQSG